MHIHNVYIYIYLQAFKLINMIEFLVSVSFTLLLTGLTLPRKL